MHRRTPLVVLAFALLLAGCFDKPASESATTADAPAPPPEAEATANATLPDGHGQSAGIAETNRTEAGVGGMEHKHDYWRGREQVLLFDAIVNVSCPPCVPDGEGSPPKSVGYVKLGDLPDGTGRAMVYEGADRVELLLLAPDALLRQTHLPHPLPPRLWIQYRSAADAEWREPLEVSYGTPIDIDVEPLMTDMPHSTHSLWVFRLTTDRPERGLGVPMQVTVHRGRDVVDWPGHPDFYADKDARVVMQQHVSTHMGGYDSLVAYGNEGTWATPEKLISWDTKEVHVFVNVTSTANALSLPPTGFFLEAHNATVIGPEVTFGSRHRDIDGNDDLKSYHFALLVDADGMDGPYQPASRWGFRMMALFGDVDGTIGACPGCFPYDIEYDITIVGLDHETGTAQAMEPLP